MTYPRELQAYYDAHDDMMDAHRYTEGRWLEAQTWGFYKFARQRAVEAGYLPERPEFG